MSHLMTALAMRQNGLKPAAKVILYWLADHHNSETGLCCPSIRCLERESEMSRPAVIRWLDELERIGLISRSKRERENGSQRSTEYFLHLSDPQQNRRSHYDTRVVTNRDGGWSHSDTPLTLEDSNLGKEQEDGSGEPPLFSAMEEDQKQSEPFDDFWKVYPKKTAKPAAQKAWAKAIKVAPPQIIIDGAKKYAIWLGQGGPGEFRPPAKNPQGWLNDGRWADDDLKNVSATPHRRMVSPPSHMPVVR